MPQTPIDFEFQGETTGTGAGNAFFFALGRRYGGNVAHPNQNHFPWVIKVRTRLYDTASGGSATVQFQEQAWGSGSWVTIFTYAMTIPAAAPYVKHHSFLWKTKANVHGIRVNCSAFANGTATTLLSYGTIGTYGI